MTYSTTVVDEDNLNVFINRFSIVVVIIKTKYNIKYEFLIKSNNILKLEKKNFLDGSIDQIQLNVLNNFIFF